MISSHWCLQVPLLLSLGEMEGALTKAIDSGDTDLVYLALFRSPTLLACSLILAYLPLPFTEHAEGCDLLLQAVPRICSPKYVVGIEQMSSAAKQKANCLPTGSLRAGVHETKSLVKSCL